jgi:pimeloyl-ACP methyl ester carboxylesterase
VIIDGPGHGRSAAPQHRYTLEDCAAAALDVLDNLEVTGPVDWVGNAWGGHVGLVFASSYPQRCRSLVTLGTPVDRYRGVERAKVTALYAVYGLLGP